MSGLCHFESASVATIVLVKGNDRVESTMKAVCLTSGPTAAGKRYGDQSDPIPSRMNESPKPSIDVESQSILSSRNGVIGDNVCGGAA